MRGRLDEVSVRQRKWTNVFILYPSSPNFQTTTKKIAYSDL